MNEYMQEFMLARDVEIMNINEEHNPDNMTYEVKIFCSFSNCWNLGKLLERFLRGFRRRSLIPW
jgi:hypothetical protein